MRIAVDSKVILKKYRFNGKVSQTPFVFRAAQRAA
jgi:hypothetical protein